MKPLALIIAIIFSLMAFVSLIEGHTVNIQNKLDKGTWAVAAATKEQEGDFHWDDNDAIYQNSSGAHNGFSLWVPDDIKKFYLIFGVSGSFKDDKWRGPFDNAQDSCWHFHGHLESWSVYP